MLYPDELRALKPVVTAAPDDIPLESAGVGRGREIRTPDILLPKQTRYQTALYPDLPHSARGGILLIQLSEVNPKFAYFA
jgi:hypothetical protein